MLDYIPFPLKMFWLYYAVICCIPIIAAGIGSYFIGKRQKERIRRKLRERGLSQEV